MSDGEFSFFFIGLLLTILAIIFVAQISLQSLPDHCHLEDGSVVTMTCEEWNR